MIRMSDRVQIWLVDHARSAAPFKISTTIACRFTAATAEMVLAHAIYSTTVWTIARIGYDFSATKNRCSISGAVLDHVGVSRYGIQPDTSARFATSIRKQDFPRIDPRVEALCEEMTERLQRALKAQDQRQVVSSQCWNQALQSINMPTENPLRP